MAPDRPGHGPMPWHRLHHARDAAAPESSGPTLNEDRNPDRDAGHQPDPRLDLRPFEPEQAAAVSRWARSAREALAWCSRAQAPVPAEVIADWGRREDVSAYGLHLRGRLVAYGELWVDHDEREVEIARVIVSPAHRGRGIGRQLIRRLADQARPSYPSVVVRVRPDNDAALRCYAAAGFERVSPADEEQWNRGQPVHYAWMAHRSAR